MRPSDELPSNLCGLCETPSDPGCVGKFGMFRCGGSYIGEKIAHRGRILVGARQLGPKRKPALGGLGELAINDQPLVAVRERTCSRIDAPMSTSQPRRLNMRPSQDLATCSIASRRSISRSTALATSSAEPRR